MIILNIHIEDVDWSVQGRAAREKVIHYCIPASLLAREDDVHGPGLYALRAFVITVVGVLFAILLRMPAFAHTRHAHLPILPSLGPPFDVFVPL
jgi:hypothetical protein